VTEEALVGRIELVEQLAEHSNFLEAAYLQLMRQHEAYELRANERLKLQQKLNRLDARAAERDARQQAHGDRALERRQLVRQLSELRDQRTQVRERVIAQLNQELGPAQIRVGLNGAEYLNWSGPLSVLSSSSDLDLPKPRTLGLLTGKRTTVLFHTLKLSGKFKPVGIGG